MVEFAIALPLLFTLMALTWDTIAASILRSHAELAMLSLQLNFKEVPSRIVPNPLTFQLETVARPDAEVLTLMQQIHWHIQTSMRQSGSLADSEANVALEWYYWNIDENTGYPTAAGGQPLYTRVGPAFYRGETGEDECFGADVAQLKSDYIAARDARFAEILSWQAASPTIRIGEKLIEHQLFGTPVRKYLTKRAMVMMLTCARRPVGFLAGSAPVTTFQVFMADKEAEWSM